MPYGRMPGALLEGREEECMGTSWWRRAGADVMRAWGTAVEDDCIGD